MIKLLHCADLHLGSRFRGFSPEKSAALSSREKALLARLLALRQQEDCALVLLCGDIFDDRSPYASLRQAVCDWLEALEVPVCIAPGNHDHLGSSSVYAQTLWPSNVHIFQRQRLEALCFPQLDLRLWGAGFESMDCPGLLEGFTAHGQERWQVGMLHADPTSVTGSCCPISRRQVADSGLTYLALGHIHKAGKFTAGSTLCAWPGCPMGRGFDETGSKGALVVTLHDAAPALRFFDLGLGRFESIQVPVTKDPLEDILNVLPQRTEQDIYRITLTGQTAELNISQLQALLSPRFFDLTLIDETRPPVSIWTNADADTLEGLYFRLLRQALEVTDTEETARLAAQLSRRLLDGEEVTLP